MYFSAYVFILNVLYDQHCDFWHFLLICDTGWVIFWSMFVHLTSYLEDISRKDISTT